MGIIKSAVATVELDQTCQAFYEWIGYNELHYVVFWNKNQEKKCSFRYFLSKKRIWAKQGGRWNEMKITGIWETSQREKVIYSTDSFLSPDRNTAVKQIGPRAGNKTER